MNRLQDALRPWHWGLLALCLIWSKWLYFPPDVTFLWPSDLPVLLSQADVAEVDGTWQVPATRFSLFSSLQQMPLFFSACCFALFFGSIVSHKNLVFAFFALILMCIVASPDQLICAVLTGMVCQKFTSGVKPHRVIMKSWLALMAAVCFSIDFGFVVLAVLFLVLFQATAARWKFSIGAISIVAVTLGSLLFSALVPGFLNAAMRPFWAIFVARQSDLFPRLEPLYLTQSGSSCLVGIIILLGCRVGFLSRSKQSATSSSSVPKMSGADSNRLVVAVVFAILAASSFYSLLPCLVAMICLPDACGGSAARDKNKATESSVLTRVIIAGPLVGILVGLLMSEPGWSTITGVKRQVDLRNSGISGNVLLLNPNDCEQWNQSRLAGEVTLVADSRWDRVDWDLRQYETGCLDIMAGREDLELRPDGSVGGYRDFIKQHNVSVISVSTKLRTTLRHLSTNPKWQLSALDCRQAVFESSGTPAAKMRSRRMSQLLLHFEWPDSRRSFNPEGILELGDLASARQVALALTAMHLPFASLRCVHADESNQGIRVRQDAYLELAIRMRDQCGCDSLADLWRAFQPEGATAEAMHFRDISSPLWSESDEGLSSDTPEGKVRAALASGDLLTSLRWLPEISDGAIRDYYQTLIHLSPTTGHLDSVDLKLSALPLRLRDEGLMIMANLALEQGDASKTIQLLADSLETLPDSKFTALRAFYLQQLIR